VASLICRPSRRAADTTSIPRAAELTIRLAAFRYHIMVLWMRTLTERSQKNRTAWDRINQPSNFFGSVN
jgi:hypothetical protein